MEANNSTTQYESILNELIDFVSMEEKLLIDFIEIQNREKKTKVTTVEEKEVKKVEEISDMFYITELRQIIDANKEILNKRKNNI